MTMNPESTLEIHVRLLDEGTDCSRPTRGISLGQGLFKLLATENYNPEDEHWEFVPGSVVRVKEVLDENGVYLLAVDREDS
jgi:hypothetical protein